MPQRERITASISVTMLMIVWIGLGVAHAAMLRGLDHGGALVVMVLLGHVRRRHVRLLRRPAVRPPQARAGASRPTRPSRAWLCGIVVGTLVVWYWSRTYDGDWISGIDGLLLGLAVVIAAPIGDLFESLIKRDMGTKDTGTLFGAHGGALDRVDAALFALVAGYYVWLAVAMNDEEKRDRQMMELLNELRVALPGVQILFALPPDRPVRPGLRAGHLDPDARCSTPRCCATAASTIFLIAPSATHRLRFHQRDRAFIIESANKYLIAGLVFLGGRDRPRHRDGHRLPLRPLDRLGRARRSSPSPSPSLWFLRPLLRRT